MAGYLKGLLSALTGRNKTVAAFVPEWAHMADKYPDVNLEQLEKHYVGDVYSCIRLIADAVNEVPLRLYVAKKTKEKLKMETVKATDQTHQRLAKQATTANYMTGIAEVEEVVSHPVLDLFREVNPLMNQSDFLESWVVYLTLTGEFFSAIINDENGVPVELWPLNPKDMVAVQHKIYLIDHWEHRGVNPPKKYDPSELIYCKAFNPLDVIRGYGDLRGGYMAAHLSNDMMNYEATLLKNRAVPPLAVILKGALDRPKAERAREAWEASNTGENRGRIMVLGEDVTLQPVGLSPKELGHGPGMDMARDRVGNATRVPKQLLTSDDVNKNNLYGGLHQFAKFSVTPRLRKIEQAINQDLMPKFEPGRSLFVAFDNAVPEDQEAKVKEREVNLRMGYSPINEERAKERLGKVPWGDEPMGTFQTIVTEEGEGGDSASPKDKPKPKPADKPKGHTHHKENLRPQDADLRLEITQIFERQRRHAVQQLLEVNQGDGPAIIDTTRPLLDLDKWNAVMAKAVEPIMRKLIDAGYEIGLTRLAGRKDVIQGVGIAAALEFLENKAAEFVDRMVTNVNTTTRNALIKTLEEAMANGETVSQMIPRVNEVYKHASVIRSEQIARSETKRAREYAARASYERAGVTQIEWVAGTEACEYCRPWDGKVVGIAESFAKDGQELDGDQGGKRAASFGDINHPPQHPNCTCFLLPVTE